ncbi:unnamed protein product [Rotaria sordida]|uniref:Uncharacterized protein n=1 Tax=Rotaria sordida TaxID=392033 RepID=A0A815RFK1_9BILA|nr:unnamed protein product [Rotaria sordida]CAF4115772.1 unnamed protein product [Rotaria sordida]
MAHAQHVIDQYQNGNNIDDDNTPVSIHVEEIERHINVQGNDDYDLILPYYMANIPKDIINVNIDAPIGIQPIEINENPQHDDINHLILLNQE